MSSSIIQIKQQVNQIGKQASTSASQLLQLATNLENHMATVDNAIGGAASGEDKTMITSFREASKSVKEAAESLKAAADAAKEWGAKI